MPANRWNIAQFFEIRWWKKYLGRQDVNTYLAWKRQYWHGFLERLQLDVPDQNTLSILDAGCGPAGIFLIFQEASITAVDPLIKRYQALPHFNTDWYENVAFHPVQLEKFESHQPFDWVFSLNAINHVADIERGVEQLFQLTKEGGQCIISTDCHKYQWAKALLKYIPVDILHPHQYDDDDYQSLFEKTGFNVQNKVLVKEGKVFDYYAYVLGK